MFSADAVLDNLWDPDTEPVSTLPFRSKGGELYKFKGKGVKAQDWRADGHQWINQGVVALPRNNPPPPPPPPQKKSTLMLPPLMGRQKSL